MHLSYGDGARASCQGPQPWATLPPNGSPGHQSGRDGGEAGRGFREQRRTWHDSALRLEPRMALPFSSPRGRMRSGQAHGNGRSASEGHNRPEASIPIRETGQNPLNRAAGTFGCDIREEKRPKENFVSGHSRAIGWWPCFFSRPRASIGRQRGYRDRALRDRPAARGSSPPA